MAKARGFTGLHDKAKGKIGRGLKKEFDSWKQMWYIESTKGSLRSDLPFKVLTAIVTAVNY